MTATDKTIQTDPRAAETRDGVASPFRWRVVDIVTASVLGVALGLVFILWNLTSGPLRETIGAVAPGLSALAAGVWLIPAVLGALVIRKPGAALFTETVAAVVSVLIVPNEWGWWTIEAGIVQGLGAELVFLLFFYRRFNLPVAALAGMGAGLFMAVNDLVVWYASALTPTFAVIYVISSLVTGAAAGVVAWLLVKALAKTGALSRFAAGRDHSELV